LVIYQTWHTKELPPKMGECVEKLKRDNPEFEHHLYDLKECREFIKNNFEKKVLKAYDSLIPLAYKSDLWRYCILYKKGGVYLDIKYQCENGFKFIEMVNEKETFTLDRPYGNPNNSFSEEVELFNMPNFYENDYSEISKFWENNQIGLFTTPLVSIPGNPIFMKCIQEIVKNVKNKYYGFNALYPTGPGLLGKMYFGNKYKKKIKKIKYFNSINGTYIMTKTKKILSQYPEYRQEQQMYGETGVTGVKYYGVMWTEGSIYKKNLSSNLQKTGRLK